MKKLIPLVALLFVACSNLDLDNNSILDYNSSANKILVCNDELDGKVVKPADGSEYRLCKNGQWYAVDIDDFDESSIYTVPEEGASSSDAVVAVSSSSQITVDVYDDDDAVISEPVAYSSSASIILIRPSSSSAAVKSSSSVAVFVSSSSKVVVSSSSAVVFKSSSSTVVKSSSSAAVVKSSSSKTVLSSSSVVIEPISSETEVESSSSEMESSSSAEPVSELYICDDGSVVLDLDNCPENKTEISSSDAVVESSSEVSVVSSNSNVSQGLVPSGTYDCSVYNCVTTEYLNQEILAAGKYMEFLDTRDGVVYKAIQIGNQIWMAQSLVYADSAETPNMLENSWCYDEFDGNCSDLGRLYTWTATMDIVDSYGTESAGSLINSVHRGICPAGWHVPTNDEWDVLENYFRDNANDDVATSMKSQSTWTTTYYTGTDEFGFSALAGGYRFYKGNSYVFYDISQDVNFWSATEFTSTMANERYLNYKESELGTGDYNDKSDDAGYIRCVYDELAQVSSSSVVETSSSKIESSSSAQLTTHYDCSVYNCVTTEYLNQEMLAAGKYGEFLDTRDNQVYRTITIGNQTWMAQNLNYALSGSLCESDEENCEVTGRVYDWAQVMNISSGYNTSDASSVILSPHQGICPDGFYVPTNAQWQELHDYVANASGVSSVTTELNAGKGWAETGYADSYGFSMIPGDAASDGNGRAAFWTATQLSSVRSNRWFKDYEYNPYSGYTFSNTISDPKTFTMHLRCVQEM